MVYHGPTLRQLATLALALVCVTVALCIAAGCGGGSPKTQHTGTVVEKHTEPKPITYVNAGNVIIPTGGGVYYVLVLDGPDGGAIHVSDVTWAHYAVGSVYP